MTLVVRTKIALEYLHMQRLWFCTWPITCMLSTSIITMLTTYLVPCDLWLHFHGNNGIPVHNELGANKGPLHILRRLTRCCGARTHLKSLHTSRRRQMISFCLCLSLSFLLLLSFSLLSCHSWGRLGDTLLNRSYMNDTLSSSVPVSGTFGSASATV